MKLTEVKEKDMDGNLAMADERNYANEHDFEPQIDMEEETEGSVMLKPINVIDSGDYLEPHTFESDQEAKLFYSYIEQSKYIEYLEKLLSTKDNNQKQ